MKLCPHCKQIKPDSDFGPHRTRRLQSWCRQCMKDKNADYIAALLRAGMCRWGPHPRGSDGTPTMCRKHADAAAAKTRHRSARR